MANWTFNSNDYTAREFALIPEGDHRVRITKVAEKIFSTGNEGFEITLEVNGHNSKLWYYLIYHIVPSFRNFNFKLFLSRNFTNLELGKYIGAFFIP